MELNNKMSNITTIECRDCGKPYSYPSRRGRPSVRCLECQSKYLISIGQKSSNNSEEKEISPTQENNSEVVEMAEGEIPEDNVSDDLPKEKVEENKDATYQIFVTGGLEYVYRGEIEKEALAVFKRYCAYSKGLFGSSGMQNVTLYCKGEVKEHFIFERKQ